MDKLVNTPEMHECSVRLDDMLGIPGLMMRYDLLPRVYVMCRAHLSDGSSHSST